MGMGELQKLLKLIKAAGNYTAADLAEVIGAETSIQRSGLSVTRWIDGSRKPNADIVPELTKWARAAAQEMGIALDSAPVTQ